jgi:hypothetical protein
MRKLTYFGLTLLLLAIVCIVIGAVNLAKVKSVDVGDNKNQPTTWYFACNLTSGNTYWVYIEANAAWGVPFNDGSFSTAQPVDVTITSPGNGTTSLLAYFYSISTSNPDYREGTPPAIVDVVYENVDSSSLSADLTSGTISFFVEKSGTYTVRVLDEGWIDTPPDFFVFYEQVPLNSETYTLLASAGGVLGIFGGVTVVVSIFRKGGAKHKRTRK